MSQPSNDDLDLIWGASEIARTIGCNERMAFHYLQNGEIPAKKCGRMWVASRRELRRHFLGEEAA